MMVAFSFGHQETMWLPFDWRGVNAIMNEGWEGVPGGMHGLVGSSGPSKCWAEIAEWEVWALKK
jgi:hypothetical protein